MRLILRVRHPRATITRGAEGSRWVPRSSKPVTLRSAWRGGFDSHALPPWDTAAMASDRNARSRPPGVERLLVEIRARATGDPDVLAEVSREVVAEERDRLARGAEPSSLEALADAVVGRLDRWRKAPVARTINATGVIVHTNLGRAPWPEEAIAAARAAAGSLLLEIDQSTGRRGARFRLAEEHLIALTGAEDALVTNNNAAAVALAVGLAGRGRGVGGLAGRAGRDRRGRADPGDHPAGRRAADRGRDDEPHARRGLRGAARGRPGTDSSSASTRRTSARPGFIERPMPRGGRELAHRHGAIVVDDLGSGALLPTERFALAHEPTPRERLGDGADLVTFSGDKLVGGPQAGFVVGRGDLIGRIRRDPLARAMRPDKVTLAAVAATLGLYRAGVATDRVPVWRMIAAPLDELRRRAEAVVAAIGPAASAVEVRSTIGGGSLPGETLPSLAIAIDAGTSGRAPDRLLARLRAGEPVVVGRIEAGCAVFDLRTVEAADDRALGEAIRVAMR